jgi:hypothetical protein
MSLELRARTSASASPRSPPAPSPPAGTLTAISYPDGTATAWHSTAGGGHTRHDPALAREQMAYLLARSVPADAL